MVFDVMILDSVGEGANIWRDPSSSSCFSYHLWSMTMSSRGGRFSAVELGSPAKKPKANALGFGSNSHLGKVRE